MNLIEIQNKIISEKIKLRKKSKNFVNNFKKIEKYIQKEIMIIKESKDSIIPEIELESNVITLVYKSSHTDFLCSIFFSALFTTISFD